MEELKKELTAEEQAAKMVAEHEQLKKEKPELIKETRKLNKAPKEKPPKKEVTQLTDRQKAEQTLIKVCKELKLPAPSRIAAKDASKSGLGALKAFVSGGCKVSVRSNDVVIYMPVTELGYGKVPKGWEHCAQLKWDDPNLEKAMRKGLKDKTTNAEWIRQIHPAMRSKVDRVEDLDARRKRLEAELKAVKEQAKAQKGKAKAKAAKSKEETVATEIALAAATVASN